ncbi:DUF2190 family protein [Pseudomonas sp. GX19020]|uniref:DUF2190 family protein n=1 Tax=Pseudomonas sp. GX19020 TaxID=2942277 RepID=UPI00201A1020|nr:DUF2190 family protein [Pseudomonas sp. GX19020]MCL4069006.1 DUF2190 family protein [Pseudomonas sp. GX19020]
MKSFLQKGTSLSLVALAAVASGGLVVQGVIAGVAGTDALDGDDVEVHVVGCYSLPKVAAQAWSAGDAIYVDPDDLVCSNAPEDGFILIGAAIASASNPSGFGEVRLNGSFPAAPYEA